MILGLKIDWEALNFRSRLRAWWSHYKFVHRYGVNKHRHEHYGVTLNNKQ